MSYTIEQCVALDFETYSDVDLRSAGLDNYVNGEHFRVLLACVKFYHLTDINTELTLDFVKDQGSIDILKLMLENKYIVAHNAQFEQFVLRAIGIDLPADRFIDTAVLARAAGYGGSLEAAAAQMLGQDKVEIGSELIKIFCIPSAAQVEDNELWFDESLPATLPNEWDMFKYYCKVDAALCWQIAKALLSQPYIQREIKLSHLTMQMNSVGWYVDRPLVLEMDQMYRDNTDQIRKDFARLNDAHDLNLSSLPQLIEWCKVRGVTAKSFDEKSVASMLKRIDRRLTTLAETDYRRAPLLEVRSLLITKQQLGGSSLKKLDVILKTTSSDDRLRNQYMHVGAGATFRTTGRGVQMQNLKRLHGEGDNTDLLMGGAWWDNDMLAANMRQVFKAENPNGFLIVGDFSSVESRGLAWQAGEQWKLNAYAQGQDLYKVQASQMFGVPVDQITKDQRQIGKVGELACGYGAGADAVRSFADKMGVELSEIESAKLVKDWRAANPKIVDYWQELDDALHTAVAGTPANVRLPHAIVKFTPVTAPQSLQDQTGNPNLRSLQIMFFSLNGWKAIEFTRVIHGVYEHGRNVQYWKPSERKTGDLWTDRFTDPKTKQQRKYSVYGGKLAGLLTQSLCREVFFESLAYLQPTVDKVDNLQVVGQFHDEIVVEWKPGSYPLDTALGLLHDRMTATSLIGFPLGAEIKHAYRYIK